jgi:cytoskeletal protein RodZ
MHTTLDYLDKYIQNKRSLKHPKNFLKEIKMLVIIFAITFVGMLLFTNAQLFFGVQSNDEIVERSQDTIQENNDISTAIKEDEQKQKEIEDIISIYQEKSDIIEKSTSLSSQQDLRLKLKSYDFDFNVLPPTDRLIIPKINLDVPLVDSKYKNKTDFAQ